MRILFVVPHAPHPTQGGAAIRNWHLMHAAAEAGHIVHLITPNQFSAGLDAPPRPLAVPTFRRTIAQRLRDLVFPRTPDLAHRLGAQRLRPEIARLRREHQYDAIQVEGLEMWPSVTDCAIPAIYDAHNAEATLQRRMAVQAWRDRNFVRAVYSALQARRLRRYEADAMRQAARTIAVSDSDALSLQKLAPDVTVITVPIGVDTEYYAPDRVRTRAPTTDVVFTGTLDYRANEDAAAWFIQRVWPLIRRSRPEARCAIVGRNPNAALRALNGHDGITVTGSVPDDRPYMAATSVYVLPIRFGAGVRVKLLNAMSMTCPIVATQASCEGVAVRDGQHLIVAAAEPVPFARAVLALLDAPRRGSALGQAARDWVTKQYDWSVCTPKLLAVYAEMERHDG